MPFIIIWQLSWGVSTATFGLHMKQDLQMSPFLMGVQATWGSLVLLLSTAVWGKVERHCGSRGVLIGCATVIVLHLLTWLPATKGMVWPTFITVGIGGLCWSGFNLAWFNYTQTIGSREDRLATLAIIGFAFGLSYAVGAALAGVCNRITPHYLGFAIGDWELLNYHMIILLSSTGRFLAVLRLTRALPGTVGIIGETCRVWREFFRRCRPTGAA